MRWTVGKVLFTAAQLEGVTSVSIDTGFQLLVESGDSDIFPTTVSIQKIQPSITMRSRHVDIWNTLTVNGLSYVTDAVVFYAQKRAEGGTFVAAGTAEHIKFTLGKCRIEPMGISGDPAEIELKITPYYTSAATPKYPITISTASAIT